MDDPTRRQFVRIDEMAAASLDKWDIDAAKLHAERSRQLADQAFQAETRYQEQQQSIQRLLIISATAVAVLLVVIAVRQSEHKKPKIPHTFEGETALGPLNDEPSACMSSIVSAS